MLRRRDFMLSMAGTVILAGTVRGQSPRQDYPNKFVKIIVPISAGQTSDILARALADALSRIWGQQVVVDNRPGAGSTLGTQIAAKSPADGYTLLLGASGPLAIAPHLYTDVGYDPRKDFAPIMGVAGVAQTLVVPANSKFRTAQDLIKAAKAAPGKLSYGSPGNGSTSHLTMELFKQRTGIDMQHIPYKGSPQAYPDLLAERIQVMFDASPGVVPFIQKGEMRALLVSTPHRIAPLPDVPTAGEAGINGFDSLGWMGVVAPAGIDPAIQQKLYEDLKKAVEDEGTKKTLSNLGMMPINSDPKEFQRFIDSELNKWGPVIKASGAKID